MQGFEMTQQRIAYLNARGKVILNACPGSGKTTCIVHKLAILEKECKTEYNNHVGIACLSFTNVAKNEILKKYKEIYGFDFQYPHLVSTIDSFINQYITLPYYNLINKDYSRPQIVDSSEVIEKLSKIRYPNKDGKLVEGIQAPLGNFKTKKGLPVYRSYPISSIWINANGLFTFKGKQPDNNAIDPAVFQEYGKAVFNWKLKKGIITSLDSSYIALAILRNNENVARWLVQRFPFIIIDEAQDNSEIQHAIFDKLIELGLSNIEMIGDPYQSLYEWRDAKPQLFVQKYSNTNWTGLPLSQNRRSVQRIINCFSILRNANDELITSKDVDDLNINIIVYKYTDNNHSAIVKDFEQKCSSYSFIKNHIVVRGGTLRDKMLGKTASVDPWRQPYPSRLLRIKHSFEINAIKEAVDDLRIIVLELLHSDKGYLELQDIRKEISNNYSFNGSLYSFLHKIPDTSLSIQEWTDKTIQAFSSHFNINTTSSFEFKKKINDYKMVELKQQPINLYFKKPATTDRNIPITTIHQIKGATLDAILYFLDETSTGESVSFSDFKQSTSFPSEKQRMIYVACSRPKQFLALALPEKITDKEVTQKLGGNVQIINL